MNRLFFVLALAFALRLVGIGYGLPAVYHQDEPMMVHHALAVGTGDWNTHYFVIPPFVSYFLFFLFAAFYGTGHLAGMFADPESFAARFIQDPTWFYLIARFAVPVLFGTATVWLIERTGRRFFSKEIGFLAALFLSVLPLHVQHSHYVYADTPVTFGILALLYRILALSEDRRFRSYLYLGLVLGWATSVKYTAAYAVPVIVGAHAALYRRNLLSKESLLKLFTAGGASLAIFALLAPYTFLDWTHFMASMRRQSGGESFVGWTHHLTYSLIGGTSGVFLLLAAAGIVFCLRAPGYRGGVLLGFAALFYLINSAFTQHFARYVLPILPVLAIFAARAWTSAGARLKNAAMRRMALALIIVHLGWPSAYLDFLFCRKDTRTQAAEWIESQTRGGEALAVDNRFFSPPLQREETARPANGDEYYRSEGLDALRKRRLELLRRAGTAGKRYTVYLLESEDAPVDGEFMFTGPLLPADVGRLRAAGVEYVTLNYTDKRNATHRAIRGKGAGVELVKSFSPYKDPARREPLDRHATTAAPHLLSELFSRERLGPYIEIYRIMAR